MYTHTHTYTYTHTHAQHDYTLVAYWRTSHQIRNHDGFQMAADHLKYVQMCTQTGETSTVSSSLSCSFLFWGWSSRRLCVVSCLASMKRAMPAICVSFVYMVGWTVNTCTCWWRGKLSNIRSMYMHTYIYMDMWVDAELDLFEVGYHLVQTWQSSMLVSHTCIHVPKWNLHVSLM